MNLDIYKKQISEANLQLKYGQTLYWLGLELPKFEPEPYSYEMVTVQLTKDKSFSFPSYNIERNKDRSIHEILQEVFYNNELKPLGPFEWRSLTPAERHQKEIEDMFEDTKSMLSTLEYFINSNKEKETATKNENSTRNNKSNILRKFYKCFKRFSK